MNKKVKKKNVTFAKKKRLKYEVVSLAGSYFKRKKYIFHGTRFLLEMNM